MASGNEFEVIIGADGRPLEKTLEQLTADLKQFNKELQKTNDPRLIADLNKRLKETQATIKAIRDFDGINDGLNKMRNSSSAAGGALISLNRVVQDLPFGFVAIQNNLTELPAAFGGLIKSAGGFDNALKAIGASLIGAGGIGFAFSAVSYLLTTQVQKYGSLSAAIAAMSGNIDRAAEAQKKFTDELIEANKQAGDELSKMNLLASAAADTTRSMVERRAAAKNLTDQLKEYGVALSTEAALNGQVAEATLKARDAIIARARGTAVAKRLSEVEAELLNIDVKRTGEIEKLNNAYQKLNVQQENQNKLNKQNLPFVPAITGQMLAAQTEVNDIKNTLTDLGDSERAFIEERERLISQAQNQDLRIPGLQVKDAKGTTDALKAQIDALKKVQQEVGLLKTEQKKLFELEIQLVLRDGVKQGLTTGQIARIVNDLQVQLDQSQISRIELPIRILPKANISPAGSIVGPIEQFNQTMVSRLTSLGQAAGDAYNESLRAALGNQIGKTLSDAVVPAFESIGVAIGAALSGKGGIGSAAEIFLDIIGSTLQQVGIQIVAASKAIIALKAALSSAFGEPAASLAAGLALIATGQLLKSVKFNKFAEGGLVTGPTLGLVGEAGPELIIPLNRANQFVNSSNSMEIYGTTRIDGRDLMVVYQRADQSRGSRGGPLA